MLGGGSTPAARLKVQRSYMFMWGSRIVWLLLAIFAVSSTRGYLAARAELSALRSTLNRCGGIFGDAQWVWNFKLLPCMLLHKIEESNVKRLTDTSRRMMSELDATTKLLKDAKLSQSQTSYNMEKLLAEHSTLKDETKELQSSHSAKGQSLIEEQRKSVILQTKLAAVELTLQQLRAEKGGTLTPAAVKLAATEAELGSASLLANGSPLEALETLPPPQHREEENSQALPDPPSAHATSPEHRQNLGEGLPDPLSKRAAPEEQQESLRALPDPLARHGTPEAARESDRSLPRPLPTWSGPAASQPPGTALPAPMAGPAAPEQQQETGKGMPDPLSRLAAPEALREESAKVPDRLGQQLAPEERLQETRKSLRAAAT